MQLKFIIENILQIRNSDVDKKKKKNNNSNYYRIFLIWIKLINILLFFGVLNNLLKFQANIKKYRICKYLRAIFEILSNRFTQNLFTSDIKIFCINKFFSSTTYSVKKKKKKYFSQYFTQIIFRFSFLIILQAFS